MPPCSFWSEQPYLFNRLIIAYCLQQANQPGYMVSMPVAYQNYLHHISFYSSNIHLHLCSFTAVKQNSNIVVTKQNTRRIPFFCWHHTRCSQKCHLHNKNK